MRQRSRTCLITVSRSVPNIAADIQHSARAVNFAVKTPNLDAALAENTAGCRLLVVLSATPEDNARECLGDPIAYPDLCAQKGVSDCYAQGDDKHRQRATDRRADPGAALNTQQRGRCRQSSPGMYQTLFTTCKGSSKAGISRTSSQMLSRFATRNEFTMHDHQSTSQITLQMAADKHLNKLAAFPPIGRRG